MIFLGVTDTYVRTYTTARIHPGLCCFALMRSAINMLDSRRVNNATYLHLCREFCTLVLSSIVQVSVTRKARWGHSLTAVSLGPGLTVVLEFGGSPDPPTGSEVTQPKMADTTLLELSECPHNLHTCMRSICTSVYNSVSQ